MKLCDNALPILSPLHADAIGLCVLFVITRLTVILASYKTNCSHITSQAANMLFGTYNWMLL